MSVTTSPLCIYRHLGGTSTFAISPTPIPVITLGCSSGSYIWDLSTCSTIFNGLSVPSQTVRGVQVAALCSALGTGCIHTADQPICEHTEHVAFVCGAGYTVVVMTWDLQLVSRKTLKCPKITSLCLWGTNLILSTIDGMIYFYDFLLEQLKDNKIEISAKVQEYFLRKFDKTTIFPSSRKFEILKSAVHGKKTIN